MRKTARWSFPLINFREFIPERGGRRKKQAPCTLQVRNIQTGVVRSEIEKGNANQRHWKSLPGFSLSTALVSVREDGTGMINNHYLDVYRLLLIWEMEMINCTQHQQ